MLEKVLSESPINESFKNKSVLLTGATGLVGKLIVYKILKSVQSVQNVYILIRSKDGKCFRERFHDMMRYSYGLFENLDNSLVQKLIPIEGDIKADGLGLNETDRNTIINNVSIVIHSAADVTFNTSLKEQLMTNVFGTKTMIDLSRELKSLDAFVHVSTTYSNPLEMVTEEKVYETTDYVLDILDFNKISDFELVSNELIGKFPNTYTFTKNLAENLVKREFNKGGLPTTIVRPGIVSTSLKEPFCGWFDSITSVAGGLLLIGSGLARHSLVNSDITADATPVDIVANTCIAATSNTITKYQKELRVYNCNTSCLGAPNVKQSQDLMFDFMGGYPMLKTIRSPTKVIQKNYWIPIFLIRFFSETCFAYFLDFLLLLIGRKRAVVRLVKTYQRLMKASECFLSRQWYYTNNNFIQLSEELVGNDKINFDCDVRAIDWIEYQFETYFMSRKLLMKETDEDLYRAQKFHRILKIGYTIINHLLLYLILQLLFALSPINPFFSIPLNFVGFNLITFDLRRMGSYLLISSIVFNLVNHLSDDQNRNGRFNKKKLLFELKSRYAQNLKTIT